MNSQNLLLLGVLVFMLGVLSAFAGAVIDGDTVSLVERKYSHYCLPPRTPAAGPGQGTGSVAPGTNTQRSRSNLDSNTTAKCRQLKDYQRGLVLSTVFNSLECLLGLLSLLLVKNYKSSQALRRPLRPAEGKPIFGATTGRTRAPRSAASLPDPARPPGQKGAAAAATAQRGLHPIPGGVRLHHPRRLRELRSAPRCVLHQRGRLPRV